MKKRTILAVVLSLMLACAFVLTACNDPAPTDTTTVPSAPTSFTAVAGDAQAVLSWAAPASNGGSEITKYQVTHSDTWVDVSSGTTHTFTGLTNGNQYEFKVRAVNSKGAGEAAVTHATPLKPIQQAAFTGVTANGEAWVEDTTILTLTFDVDVPLTAADITLTGAAKGALTGSGKTFTLAISNITSLIVTVQIANPEGYNITPASRTVSVHTAMDENAWEMFFGIQPDYFDYSLDGITDEIYWFWVGEDYFDALSQTLKNLGYKQVSLQTWDNGPIDGFDYTDARLQFNAESLFTIFYADGTGFAKEYGFLLLEGEALDAYNFFGAENNESLVYFFYDNEDNIEWEWEDSALLPIVRGVVEGLGYTQVEFQEYVVDEFDYLYGTPAYTLVGFHNNTFYIEAFNGETMYYSYFMLLEGEVLAAYNLFGTPPDSFDYGDYGNRLSIAWRWHGTEGDLSALFDTLFDTLTDMGMHHTDTYVSNWGGGAGIPLVDIYFSAEHGFGMYYLSFYDGDTFTEETFFTPGMFAIFTRFGIAPDDFYFYEPLDIEWVWYDADASVIAALADYFQDFPIYNEYDWSMSGNPYIAVNFMGLWYTVEIFDGTDAVYTEYLAVDYLQALIASDSFALEEGELGLAAVYTFNGVQVDAVLEELLNAVDFWPDPFNTETFTLLGLAEWLVDDFMGQDPSFLADFSEEDLYEFFEENFFGINLRNDVVYALNLISMNETIVVIVSDGAGNVTVIMNAYYRYFDAYIDEFGFAHWDYDDNFDFYIDIYDASNPHGQYLYYALVYGTSVYDLNAFDLTDGAYFMVIELSGNDMYQSMPIYFDVIDDVIIPQ
ncbi:MAG: fibronectin type III domain-containing protein [Firmicutes bacterium]|nr:fibronectin type III domain-containing protein [Bacillota bacterium]